MKIIEVNSQALATSTSAKSRLDGRSLVVVLHNLGD